VTRRVATTNEGVRFVAAHGDGGDTLTLALGSSDPLSPIRDTLRAMAARPDLPPLHGIRPDLGIDHTDGWVPATELISGLAMDDFLDTAKQRWRATPHAAAALAWKCYSFWLALPAVLGYAAARRVVLLRPDAVSWKWSADQPFLTVGVTSVEVAVLPSDPLAAGSARDRLAAGIRIVADEDALLTELRRSLVEQHLSPLLENVRNGLHISRRTFWGSLASGVAHGLSRAAEVVPGSTLETADQVLGALGVRDLVDLTPREGRAGLKVQRKSCCLAFTLPEPKICSGCCIR
jgi:hypothetical protein